MNIRSSARLVTALFSGVLFAVSAAGADEQPGALWETTSQPVMEGMPMQMPAQTQKTCVAKEWTQPPPSGDKECTSSNFAKSGDKATWTVQCTGEMPMNGTGEITFDGADAYTGSVKLAAAQMKMTVKLSGRKVGGCDNPQ